MARPHTALFSLISNLQDALDNHDCHASPEDGCDCVTCYDIAEELDYDTREAEATGN